MTIPPELDFSQVKSDKLVDSNLPEWVMLEGCQGTDELFEITLTDVLNPTEEVATSQFSIIVLNSQMQEIQGIDTITLPAETFEFPSGKV